MSETPFATVELSDPRFERDGLRVVTVKSAALGRRGDVSVYVPPGGSEPLPLVILLHGVNGSHWSWSPRVTGRMVRPSCISAPLRYGTSPSPRT